MDLLLYTGPLLLGFGLSLFLKLTANIPLTLAKTTLYLTLLLTISSWIYYFAGIKNAALLKVMSLELLWVGITIRLLYGYLLGYLTSGYKRAENEHGPYAVWNTTLWAATISVANTFITATIGDFMNMPYTISFFQQSGYTIWFLYFIMTASAAGAIGLLLHFKLKTGPAASIGLLIIMLGAVYTHWHNGDPFSDSNAAVRQLIAESLLLYLYFLGRTTSKVIPTI